MAREARAVEEAGSAGSACSRVADDAAKKEAVLALVEVEVGVEVELVEVGENFLRKVVGKELLRVVAVALSFCRLQCMVLVGVQEDRNVK